MTYTPSKFPRALAYGTASGIAGSVLSGMTSNGGLTFFSGTKISIPATGYYMIAAAGRGGAQNALQTITLSLTHQNSSSVDIGWAGFSGRMSSSGQSASGTNTDASYHDVGVHAFGLFTAGEFVLVTEAHSWTGITSFDLEVVFIPTPANPQ